MLYFRSCFLFPDIFPLRIENKSLCSSLDPTQVACGTQCSAHTPTSLSTILPHCTEAGLGGEGSESKRWMPFPGFLTCTLHVGPCMSDSQCKQRIARLSYTRKAISRLSAFPLSSIPQNISLSSFPSLSYIFNFSVYTLGIFLWSINSLRCAILKSNSPTLVLSLLIFLLPSQPAPRRHNLHMLSLLHYRLLVLHRPAARLLSFHSAEATLTGSSVTS